MKLDLSGKKILVTGASRGIGFAITEALLQAGARVIAHYHQTPQPLEELRNKYPECYPCKADLSDEADISSIIPGILDREGRLDVLINNAGIALQSPITRNTADWLRDWDKTITVNLTATGVLCRAAVLHFVEIQGGIIINIASRASFRGDTPEYMAYAASKGGVVSLTRSIARHFGKNGVTAFTIAPGFVRTDMAEQFIEEYGEDFVKSDIALKKLTQPADIAPTIVFLASGNAEHATGATIDINAGSYVH